MDLFTLLFLSVFLPCQASPSAAEWVSKLEGSDSRQAEAALIALRMEALPALKSGFETGSIATRRGVLRVARGIGTQAAELAPGFAQYFRAPDLDEGLAWEIAPTVGALGTGAKRAANEWSAMILDKELDADRRGFAMLACSTLGENASPAVDALIEVLAERPVSPLHAFAAIALGSMPKAAVPKIDRRLAKLDGIEFTWHLMALVHCGDKAKACAKGLAPYALTNDWKQHPAVQTIVSQCLSERAAEASLEAERMREYSIHKGGMYTEEVRENPRVFLEFLKPLDPKFADPEFAIEFPERLPARFPVLKFAIGDVEEGLADHLLTRLIENHALLRDGKLTTWSGLHRAYDGLAGLAEGLAVIHDHSPGRTQPGKR